MNTGPYGQYQANMGAHAANPTAAVTSTLVIAGNPNSLGIISIVAPALAYDTADNSIWGTTDGTTWTVIGGGGSGATYVYSGFGPPVSVPSNPAFYFDKSNGDIWAWNGASWDQLTAH